MNDVSKTAVVMASKPPKLKPDTKDQKYKENSNDKKCYGCKTSVSSFIPQYCSCGLTTCYLCANVVSSNCPICSVCAPDLNPTNDPYIPPGVW